jgi:hypothetical protein
VIGIVEHRHQVRDVAVGTEPDGAPGRLAMGELRIFGQPAQLRLDILTREHGAERSKPKIL